MAKKPFTRFDFCVSPTAIGLLSVPPELSSPALMGTKACAILDTAEMFVPKKWGVCRPNNEDYQLPEPDGRPVITFENVTKIPCGTMIAFTWRTNADRLVEKWIYVLADEVSWKRSGLAHSDFVIVTQDVWGPYADPSAAYHDNKLGLIGGPKTKAKHPTTAELYHHLGHEEAQLMQRLTRQLWFQQMVSETCPKLFTRGETEANSPLWREAGRLMATTFVDKQSLAEATATVIERFQKKHPYMQRLHSIALSVCRQEIKEREEFSKSAPLCIAEEKQAREFQHEFGVHW